MTMTIMMIIITFCALDILILEFLTCKWQLVWNMLIKSLLLLQLSNTQQFYSTLKTGIIPLAGSPVF